MPTPKHTPGPWIHVPQYDSIVSHDPEFVNNLICKLATGENYFEEKANAKLIAAAPELLAACQFALEWIEELRASNPDALPRKGWGTLELQTAIDKATK